MQIHYWIKTGPLSHEETEWQEASWNDFSTPINGDEYDRDADLNKIYALGIDLLTKLSPETATQHHHMSISPSMILINPDGHNYPEFVFSI